MNNQKLFGRGVLLAVVAGLFAAGSGSAATLIKSGSGIWDYNNTLFSSASNWTNNTDTAQFSSKPVTINVSTGNGPVGAAGLIFLQGGATFTNQPLQIGAGGISTTPQNNGTLVFSNDLQLTVSQVWRSAPNNSDFAVYGNLSGTGTTANLIFDALGYNGQLILYGSNSLSGTMTVQNTGRLLLDYGAMGQNNSKLDAANSLILSNSADIQWQSGGASSFTQAVNGLTLAGSGYFYLNRVNSNNVMSVGPITRTGVGSTLRFGNTNGAVTTSSSKQNGILGAWAVTVAGWATNGTDGAIAEYQGLNQTNSLLWNTTDNINLDKGTLVTMAGDKTNNTLRLGTPTRFDLNGGTLTLNAGGLMAVSANPTLSNGSIQSGLPSGELFVYASGANLTNSVTIKDNVATPTVLVKAGANTLVLAGPNTYSGATYINQGTLLLADGGTLGTNAINVSLNSTLTFNRSDTFSLTNTITGSGNGGGIVQNIGSGVVNLTTSNSTFGVPHIVYNRDSFQSQMKNTGLGTLNVNLGGTNVFGIIDNSGSGKLTLTGKDAVNTVVSLRASGSGGGMILTNVSVNTINAGGNQGNMSVIGSATNSVGCYLIIAGTNGPNQQTTYSGGWMYLPSQANTSSSNNYVMVSEGGVLTNCTFMFGGYGATGPNNGLIITNGGRVYGSPTLGYGTGCSSNYIYVGGTGSGGNNALLNGGVLYVGQGNAAGVYGNWMKVDQGGVVLSVNASIGNGVSNEYNRAQVTGSGLWGVGGTMSVGVGLTNANFNSLLVDNGGMVTNITTLSVGVAGANANNYSNVVSVTSGGLLEIKTGISIANNSGATSSGNYVTNFGGILQFTANTPAIAIRDKTQNGIVITNGTVSFRNVNAAPVVNLTNNWVDSGIGTNGVVWQGNNTLRLDGSTATNTLGRPYQFNTDLGPTNYVNLEMLGTSFIKGAGVSNGVTIGAAGSMLVSNGTANITGALTNNGTVTLAGSPAVLMATNTFYNNGLLTGSGTVSGLVTVGSAGILSPGGSNGIGTLTFSTNVVFNGGTNILTFTSSTNDQIRVLGTISGTNYLQIVPSPPGATLPENGVLFTFTTKDSATYIRSITDGYAVTLTPSNVTLRASSRGCLMIIK